MAEWMARHKLEQAFGRRVAYEVRVLSAGTHASATGAMHPGTARILEERGITVGGFTSTPVTAQLIDGTDLVLTAAREQRALCVSLLPRSAPKVFTLRQFARSAGALPRPLDQELASPASRLQALLEQVTRNRSRMQPVSADADDLIDPVRGPLAAFRACSRTVEENLDTIIGAATRT